MNAPACIIAANTDPKTGRIVTLRVCSWCEHENKEIEALRLYCRGVNQLHPDKEPVMITNLICTEHYNKQMEALKIE